MDLPVSGLIVGGEVFEPVTVELPVKLLVLVLLPLTVGVVDDKNDGKAREHESSLSSSVPRFWLICTLHCPKTSAGAPLESTFGPPLTREYASP